MLKQEPETLDDLFCICGSKLVSKESCHGYGCDLCDESMHNFDDDFYHCNSDRNQTMLIHDYGFDVCLPCVNKLLKQTPKPNPLKFYCQVCHHYHDKSKKIQKCQYLVSGFMRDALDISINDIITSIDKFLTDVIYVKVAYKEDWNELLNKFSHLKNDNALDTLFIRMKRNSDINDVINAMSKYYEIDHREVLFFSPIKLCGYNKISRSTKIKNILFDKKEFEWIYCENNQITSNFIDNIYTTEAYENKAYDIDSEPDIPDNFLDTVFNQARMNHDQFEARQVALQQDFERYLDVNVARNLAVNLATYMDHEDNNNPFMTDSDDDDMDTNEQKGNSISNTSPNFIDGSRDNNNGNDNMDKINDNQSLDELLQKTATAHQRVESREQYLNDNLGAILQNINQQKGVTNDIDVNPFANTLASFIGSSTDNNNDSNNNNNSNNDNKNDNETLDDLLMQTANAHQRVQSREQFLTDNLGAIFQNINEQKGITNDDININPFANTLASFIGGSTDDNNNDTNNTDNSTILQLTKKANELENRLQYLQNNIIDKDQKYADLELKNIELLKQIKHLQYAKAELSLVTNNEINKLRNHIKMYQKYYQQNQR